MKIKFVISNIIGLLFEYGFLLLILYLLKVKFITSLIIIGIIFLVNLVIVIIALSFSQDIKNSKDNIDHHYLIIDETINNINKSLGLDLKVMYVDLAQPNHAWCIGKTIFINYRYDIDERLLQGVCGHEIGHVVSGLSIIANIASIKLSSILSRITFFFVIFFSKGHSLFFRILTKILYVIYSLFSLNNIIFVYPFLVQDEFDANLFCAKSGFGEHIRTYYGIAKSLPQSDILRKTDFTHPSIQDMIDELDNYLKIDKSLKDLYYIKNTLYVCYKKTLTLTIPTFIDTIECNAFIYDDYVKINAPQVKKIEFRNFKDFSSLESLSIPNCEHFDYSLLRVLKNLNTITVSNKEIREKLINEYNFIGNKRNNTLRKGR